MLLDKHLVAVGTAKRDEAGVQTLARVPGLFDASRKASAETVDLVRQNRKYEASVMLGETTLPALARLMQPLQAEKLRQAATLDAGITAVDELASYAKWMVLATLLEAVGAIQRVNCIVGDISSASAEQSTGVGEVGQAVSQMDRNTQENAALVEQGAAAAESLRPQAQALVQAVAVFRLG